MREDRLPTAEQMLANAEHELDKAYRALGDASDWLRSDWQPLGSPLTAEQSRRRDAMWRGIEAAKTAVIRATA